MTGTTPALLSERLKKEGEKVIAYFESLSDHHWNTIVYSDGNTWTVRDILAHFVTSEKGLHKLFISICEGGSGSSDDFSIDRYNARQQEKTRNLSPGELLARFDDVRTDLAKWVSKLEAAELELEGRHPYLGQVKLVEMIKMINIHAQIHFRDFRKLID